MTVLEHQTASNMSNPHIQNRSKTLAENVNIPLLIDGLPVFKASAARTQKISPTGFFQGADISDCSKAIESCSNAFGSWSQSSPLERRRLFLKLAHVGDLVLVSEMHYPVCRVQY